MTYRFIYAQADVRRIIQSVLIDSRASIPELAGKDGNVTKVFVDAQIAMVTGNVLFYKIELLPNSNLVGYFSLQVVRDGVVVILQKELRPAFHQFDAEISAQISSFITANLWKNDHL